MASITFDLESKVLTVQIKTPFIMTLFILKGKENITPCIHSTINNNANICEI